MPADKNVNVCTATSSRLLVEVDANRTGQRPNGLFTQAAQTSYVRRRPTPDPSRRNKIP